MTTHPYSPGLPKNFRPNMLKCKLFHTLVRGSVPHSGERQCSPLWWEAAGTWVRTEASRIGGDKTWMTSQQQDAVSTKPEDVESEGPVYANLFMKIEVPLPSDEVNGSQNQVKWPLCQCQQNYRYNLSGNVWQTSHVGVILERGGTLRRWPWQEDMGH